MATDYKILQSEDSSDLELIVNNKLKEDWKLCGGLQVTNEQYVDYTDYEIKKHRIIFYQAIQRELYSPDIKSIEVYSAMNPGSTGGGGGGVISTVNDKDEHVAKCLGDLVTGKQLAIIKGLGRQLGIDLKAECNKVMKCNFDEMSKKGASKFINHLYMLIRR